MRRSAGCLATAAALAAMVSSVSAAARDIGDVDLARERAAIEQFQDADQKLQDVGWQLASANAAFCKRAIPAIGLQLQDLASYGSPDIARAALEMRGDFAVQTAARGSPAAETGQFTRNREISRIGAIDPNAWEAEERLYWQRLTSAHDAIDRHLAQDSAVTFGFANGAEVQVEPVSACATRFELSGDGGRAVADGSRVVIGIKFDGFDYPEAVFAGAVAHELAHNLLGHRAWLDRNKRGRRNVRSTEREADRLMPWLLANAGYDPAVSVQFLEQYKPTSGAVLFIGGSHDKWKDRVRRVSAELPRIRQLMESHGRADWSVHFKREIDPDKGR